YQEVVCRRTPDLSQPFQVRLEASGGEHDGARPYELLLSGNAHGGGFETAVANLQARYVRVVHHTHAAAFGRRIVAVHQRLAATEKKRVRSPELQRASQRRLKADAEPTHSLRRVGRGAHDHAGKRFVGCSTGDAEQIGHEFVFGVVTDEDIRWRVVHA